MDTNVNTLKAPSPMLDVVMVGPFPADPSLIRGGVQASVYGLSRALSGRGDIGRVSVLALPTKPDMRTALAISMVEGIEVTRLTAPCNSFALSLVHLPRAMRVIRRHAQLVVHVHGTGPFQAALLALLRLRRVPSVWTLHGITETETWQRYQERRTAANFLRHRLYRFLERFSLRVAPVTVFDTPYVRAAVPPPAGDVYVIPQGIFTAEFSCLSHASRDTPPLILSLGVLSSRKGHHLTLEAFSHVRGKVPAARLVIAGAATEPDYHRWLKARVDELGLVGAVEIRADLPRAEILSLLSQTRVFALHSQEESQGIALCEALAAGLPVVATDVGGIPHVVADGETGILVAYGDVPGFAAAITALLIDPPLHARMAGQARRAGERFDWDAIAGRMACIYYNAPAPRCRDDAEMEETIQAYIQAGWLFDAAAHTLIDPHDRERTITIDPQNRRYLLSPKLATAIAGRVVRVR